MQNSNKKPHRKNVIFKATENSELMKFLLEKLKGQSRTNIKKLLSEKQILVNNILSSQFNQPIVIGDTIEIMYNKVRGTEITGLKIIYEDADIIVIDKEAGVLSIATDNEREKTAYNTLKVYLKERDPNNKIFVVHRLDRDTSGVMIYAKNAETQHKLQTNWSDIVTERMYVAVVEGKVPKDEDTIISYLKENSALVTVSTPTEVPGSKKAISNYKVIKRSHAFSLVEVKIETGRKNQIRVHMQDLGHPIIGDSKYSSTKNPLSRLGLHARTIVFKHPKTGEILHFNSPTPVKFIGMFKVSKK